MAGLPGPEDDYGWRTVQSEIGALRGIGYCVIDCTRLDAADYGAPQHRFRTFWFGHLDGPCIRWPARTHAPSGLCATSTIPGVEPLRPYAVAGLGFEWRIPSKTLRHGSAFRTDATFDGATKRSRRSQIDHAVPPALAEAVGRAVLATFASVRAAA